VILKFRSNIHEKVLCKNFEIKYDERLMKKPFFRLTGKLASIVDPIMEGLSDVFERGTEKFTPEVSRNIQHGLSVISSYLSKFHPGVKITHHEVIGAAVTHQYTPKSDIDTTVFINISETDPRFKIINDWIGKNVDNTMYFGKRPFQFKIRPDSSVGAQNANADAIYDPTEGRFVKKQDLIAASRSYRQLVESGGSAERKEYSRLKERLRGMARSWAKVGRQALESGKPSLSRKWLEPQAREMAAALKRAKSLRGEAYSQPAAPGRISQNWGRGNILFKMLERDGYIELFSLIKKALENRQALHPGHLAASVEMAEQIMNQRIGFDPTAKQE